jgi:hypothetical protein
MRGLIALLLFVGLAHADDDKKSGFSHHKQFQLSARLAFGLRGIATYDETVYCGDTDTTTTSGFAPVCTGRSPLAIDFEFGYGIKKAIDLFAELRIGVEADFGRTPMMNDGPHEVHLSPGARFFFSEEGRLKVFTTAQFVIDFSSYEDSAGKSLGTDFGVRNMSGIWVDLTRSYGFYGFIGATATAVRWFRFEFEGGVGFQGRYP